MSSFEEIGSLLGFVAFAGLAVLVFLTFQQARHLRRLRDWAGRAPERAAAIAAGTPEAADEAVEGAAADERDVDDSDSRDFPIARKPAEAPKRREPRFAGLRAGFADRWAAFDRRSPVEPKIVLGGLAAVILGVGIATSGFGLLGGDSPTATGQAQQGKSGKGGKGGGGGGSEPPAMTVAVLNGTAAPGGVAVPGVADRVSGDVEGAGFEVGTVDNAPPSFPASVVMYSGANEDAANELADALNGVLGTTVVQEMTSEIEAIAGGADLAVIVGQDDSAI